MSGLTTLLSQCSNRRELKKGGQKTVYFAEHPLYGQVAIKIGNYASSTSLERITREVQLLRSLNSEYFPKNYEFLVDPTQKQFLIVEEFLNCVPLSEAASRFDNEIRIISFLRHIINGMSMVWNQRIVHRDLKPDNILITDGLRPRIIDFGIARFLDKVSLTRTIAPMGPATLRYAAPEQLWNRKTEIDMRTDFFILGIIILELHLGFHPFHPERVQNDQPIPQNIITGTYVIPSTQTPTSPEFEYLIKRLLQTEPYLRFRNYQVLSEYIDNQWEQIL